MKDFWSSGWLNKGKMIFSLDKYLRMFDNLRGHSIPEEEE
jgi:hypothetical protein